MPPGSVHLVGAGPGAPGLLTLRGRECLERAEVVIYDQLANPALLGFAPRKALRIFAGKHGRGERLLEQAEINALLIEHARAGRRVVRLKGGDPMLFGRGAEEACVLAAAGIVFEIVPGVSSALAVPACAGIPVTHRDWVSGVTILTGHEAAPKGAGPVRWELIATAGNTIVLLMGVVQMAHNLEALRAAGLSDDTPAAAIRWGSTPRQTTVVGTVASLAELVATHRLRPPVTVVIGEVVRLREQIAWFEKRPLFGRRILVTRARHQAGRLQAELAALGAEPVEIAAIEIAPPVEPGPLQNALAQIENYDWIVLTSENGVHHFVAALLASGRDLRDLHRARLAAIGPATARALAACGLRADLVPEEFVAESLVEAFRESGTLAGQRVLLARAAGAREILPRELRVLGAQVDEVHTYVSRIPAEAPEQARLAIADGPLDAVTFTSSSTVKHTLEVLDATGVGGARAWLEQARVICIGPVTATTARERGLRVDAVAETYTIDGLVTALGNLLAPS